MHLKLIVFAWKEIPLIPVGLISSLVFLTFVVPFKIGEKAGKCRDKERSLLCKLIMGGKDQAVPGKGGLKLCREEEEEDWQPDNIPCGGQTQATLAGFEADICGYFGKQFLCVLVCFSGCIGSRIMFTVGFTPVSSFCCSEK